MSFFSIACLILVSATPGSTQQPRPYWNTSRIQGTPAPPPQYAVKPAFPNLKFNHPTSLEEIPGNKMLVAEIGGNLHVFDKTRKTINQSVEVLHLKEVSLWHATIHPNFKQNHFVFVCYSKAGISTVSRFQMDANSLIVDPDSEVKFVTWPAGGHNGGCLAFGKDGMLYVSTGDGSGPNPPDGRTAGQDITNLFGCILRIDVNRKSPGKNYTIPPDNPFKDSANGRGEIWAYGLRNPWKFGIDHQTGRIFAADNGWETWEMVHEIVRGGNCGWPIMEARAILRAEVKRGPTPIIPPIKDHHHSEANSVIGGPVYRGPKLTGLNGTFVYGDYITGTIWGIRPGNSGNHQFETLVDTDLRIIAFAEGRQGELYVLDYDYTGQIYELVPSGLEDQSAEFPRLLSETGIFKSLSPMTPSAGVIPYDVNVKRWIDGAQSRRWIGIPGKGTIDLPTQKAKAVYPEGTVIVKHLELGQPGSTSPPIPLETQILHYENGTWHPYSYVWDQLSGAGSGHEARLVEPTGGNFEIPPSNSSENKQSTQRWHVSAVNECRLCHNAGSDFVLGFTAHQLNRSVERTPTNLVANQVSQLHREQIISAETGLDKKDNWRLVDPFDEKFSLNERARSYLHGNCSSCHHPGGNAIVSFYLNRQLPYEKMRTNKGTGIGTFSMQNAKVIVPGDPYRSVLFYRMMKLGYARMPYIGSYKVDSRGVALVEAWIRQLPHQPSQLDSPPLQDESAAARALKSLESHRSQRLSANHPPVQTLLQTTEGALALAARIHSGKISNLNSAQIYRSTPPDIRGLFETFVPEAIRRKTLGNSPDLENLVQLKGNAKRGQLIFNSDGARCVNCHHPSEPVRSVGPTLAEIRKKYKSKTELLQNILDPDLTIDEKFTTWIISTEAGVTHSGLLIEQNTQRIRLKTAEGKTINLPKGEIDNIKKSKQSLMPRNILADLTAQEAADLVEWFSVNQD
ncbi:MAG: PQQ-dependent sugar dehydrogenase [Planctomycetota bacterium]|nr:PQQ-dependent sugar dehydrogenase [Planctomycetota bacterium]